MAAQNNPVVSSLQNTVTEEFIGTTLQSDILRNLVNETLNEERRKQNAERALLFANNFDDINLDYVRNLLYKKTDNYLPIRNTRKFSLVPSFLFDLLISVLVDQKKYWLKLINLKFFFCSPFTIKLIPIHAFNLIIFFYAVALKCLMCYIFCS